MIKKWLLLATAAFFLATVGSVFAQNNGALSTQNSDLLRTYDVNREQTVVGTVLTYAASSETPPLGPHLTLQTASGVVDVHLGDARTLAANHFIIQTGDTLRIIGENIILPNSSTQFLARILQKGAQAIVVRTAHGLPIPALPSDGSRKSKKQEGVM